MVKCATILHINKIGYHQIFYKKVPVDFIAAPHSLANSSKNVRNFVLKMVFRYILANISVTVSLTTNLYMNKIV